VIAFVRVSSVNVNNIIALSDCFFQKDLKLSIALFVVISKKTFLFDRRETFAIISISHFNQDNSRKK